MHGKLLGLYMSENIYITLSHLNDNLNTILSFRVLFFRYVKNTTPLSSHTILLLRSL